MKFFLLGFWWEGETWIPTCWLLFFFLLLSFYGGSRSFLLRGWGLGSVGFICVYFPVGCCGLPLESKILLHLFQSRLTLHKPVPSLHILLNLLCWCIWSPASTFSHRSQRWRWKLLLWQVSVSLWGSWMVWLPACPWGRYSPGWSPARTCWWLFGCTFPWWQ